jgi:hypothetical protein
VSNSDFLVMACPALIGAIIGGVIGSGLLGPWRQHRLAQRRESDAVRTAFRGYLEPIIAHYEREDACSIQAVYRAGNNFINWNEFHDQAKKVRPHVSRNPLIFDRACNVMEGVAFGEYAERAKNQAAKNELLKHLKEVLAFAQ